MLKDETDDILAALDATHSRLAQQVAGSAPAQPEAATTWEDLLAREQVQPVDLSLAAPSASEPVSRTPTLTPPPGAGAALPGGRGQEGLVGVQQYSSADLLAAFDSASTVQAGGAPPPEPPKTVHAGGLGQQGLVGLKQYSSADLLGAFDSASAVQAGGGGPTSSSAPPPLLHGTLQPLERSAIRVGPPFLSPKAPTTNFTRYYQ